MNETNQNESEVNQIKYIYPFDNHYKSYLNYTKFIREKRYDLNECLSNKSFDDKLIGRV